MARSAMGRRALAVAALAALVLSQAGIASAATPPTLAADPASGPSGLSVVLTGAHYTKGVTYTFCMEPANATANCGYAGVIVGTSLADATGSLAATTVTIPDYRAGAFVILAFAPNVAPPVASVSFTVTEPSLSLSASSGASGTAVTLAGSGFAPNVAYTMCLNAIADFGCGYTGIQLPDVTTDATGALPAGTRVTVPAIAPGSEHIGLFLKGGNPTLITAAPFTVAAPTIQLDTTGGPGGTVVTLSGSGYAPNVQYGVCWQPAAQTGCGYVGVVIASFTADATGAIPAGTTLTIPAGNAGPEQLAIVLGTGGGTDLVAAPFALAAGTLPPATSEPTEPPATAAPAPSASAGAAEATPQPSATSVASSDQGGGFPIVLLLLLLIIIAIVVFLWWRSRGDRNRGDRPAA